MNISFPVKSLSILGTASLALLTVAGCSQTDDAGHTAHESEASVSLNPTDSATATVQEGLTIDSAWVKASHSEMTAAFANLTNATDEPIVITGASTKVTDDVQLHATEIDSKTGSSSMKKVDSFTIEPGDTFSLEPSGNHLMFMDMKCAISAGSTVKITLQAQSGKKYEFEAPARDFQGAKEEYAPGQEASASNSASEHSMDGHSMENMDMSSSSAMPECTE